jgi:uncharacterized repeat protein (TIGR01451 family)
MSARRALLFTLALFVAAPLASAQPERPASFDGGALPLAAVERLALPALDHDALLGRDEAVAHRSPNPVPLQFAEPFDLALRAESAGTWEALPDGRRLWRLVVDSPGAYSLNVGFRPFRLPEGAALWLYPEGEAPAFRAFTAADNPPSGELWTPIVPGDRLVIELDLPASKGPPDFELGIGRVSHAYRPFGVPGVEVREKRGNSCNVDVACPQGDGYRDVIRSVGAYTQSGTRTCSGAAINNTAGDGKPLFLTAAHCENTPANAPSVVVYWNYENSTCRPPNTPEAGGPGDGPLTQFNTGATFRADGAASDWALLELNTPFDPAHGVYLAGWDRRDRVTSRSVAVHHPQVLEKRISFDDDPTTVTTYSSNTPQANGTHLRVGSWEVGTTEGGSSGSPLFSPEQRIVGQLHGGAAACGNTAPDWYGRLFHSMNTGLAPFLDPTNSNAETIGGRESASTLLASLLVSPTVVEPGGTVSLTVTLRNTTGAPLAGAVYAHDLPASLAFVEVVSATAGTASGTGGAVRWTVDVPAGGTETLAYIVRVSETARSDVQTTATVSHPALEAPLPLLATIAVLVEADRVFSNTQVVGVPDNQCPTYTTSSIPVPEDFAWDRLKVGVQVQHTWRGDLRVRVQSPTGTTVNLLERVGGPDQNLNALFSDTGPAGAFSGGTHNITGSPFLVEGQPQRAGTGGAVQPLSSFNGQSPLGTWTLGVCDAAPSDLGSIRQWALLFFTPEGTAVEYTSGVEGPFALSGGYPNPFGEATTLTLSVREGQAVRAEAYDPLGRLVRVLHEGPVAAGSPHALTLEGTGLPSGVYVVRVSGEAFAASRRVLLVR